jgi:hypothetical protein
MYAIDSLKTDINITLALMGDTPLRKKAYPDNEWGIALRHFDVMTTWFGMARMEGKEDSLRRKTINEENPEKEEMTSWEKWQEDNPNLFSIPNIPILHDAMEKALAFCKAPPPPLRECLEHLADGHELVQDDLFVFLQMYAEFISSVEILYSWNPEEGDPLNHLRGAREKTNRDRWKIYAAKQISNIMKETGIPIQDARDAFAADVKQTILQKTCPDGWSVEDFQIFLSAPADDKKTARLSKSYGQNLTQKQLDKWKKR